MNCISALLKEAGNIPSPGKQRPTAEIGLPSKAIIRINGQIKSFPDKKTPKEFIIPNHYYTKC